MYEEEDSSPREETCRQRSEEVIEIHSANSSDYGQAQSSSDELAQSIEESSRIQGSLLAGNEEVKNTRSLRSSNTKSINPSQHFGIVQELVPNNPNLQESENELEKIKNVTKKRKMKSWEFGDRYAKRVKPGPDFSPSIPSAHCLRSVKIISGGPKPLNRLKKKDTEGQTPKNATADISMSNLKSSGCRLKGRNSSSRKWQLEANDSHRNKFDLERSSKRTILHDSDKLEALTSGSSQNKNLNHPVPELWKVDELVRIKRKSRFKAEKLSSDTKLSTLSRAKRKYSDSASTENCAANIINNDANDTDTPDDEVKEVEIDSTTFSNFKKREKLLKNNGKLGPNPLSPRKRLYNSYFKNEIRHFVQSPRLLPRDTAKTSSNQTNLGSVDISDKNSMSEAKEYYEIYSAKNSNENAVQQPNPDLSLDEISVAHYDDTSRRNKIRNPSKNDANLNRRLSSTDDYEKPLDMEITSNYFNQLGKNGSSLVKEVHHKKIYSVLQVFCKSKLWLENRESQMDSRREWSLHFDPKEKSLKIFDENNNCIPDLSLGRINSIQASQTQGKMVIFKPISAQELVGTHQICLELRNPKESQNFLRRLRKCDSNIEILYKDQDFFEKVFENIQRIVKSIVVRPKSEKVEYRVSSKTQEAEDLSPIKIRAVQKKNDAKCDTISHQHQQSGPISIAKSMTTRLQRIPIDERLINASKTLTSNLLQIPGENYSENKLELAQEAPRTRSSKPYVSGNNAAHSAPPDIEKERWTRSNPDWKDKWYSSIVYPPIGKNKATVDCADIERLDEGEFLNDNLMMFYLRWLQQKVEQESPEIAKRVYFHNTFFYERLTSIERGKSGINYENVERWTSKVKLFEYDYIVVPINENFHWYVALICNAPKLLGKSKNSGEAFESSESIQGSDVDTVMNRMSLSNKFEENYDSETDPVLLTNSDVEIVQAVSPKKQKKQSEYPLVNTDSQKKISSDPRIITLDSFGRSHSLTCTNLKKYLLREVESKLNTTIDDPGNLGKTAKHIPQQDNFSDCGLFVLGYIEIFLRNPDNFVSDLLRNKFPNDIRWKKPSEMRANIRSLLFKLQRENLKLITEPN
ncbi:putative ulp1 protease family protein [Erysiphe necator]|uniref:Putative ulp1 protease family protein n=1 Tax=Uncinula necator TaxID=52586 RepID=A0A0B1NYU9_UNCNE|nr:putative ulp1 protease family protein [Erysiphe necator]